MLHPIHQTPGLAPIDLTLFTCIELQGEENLALALLTLSQIPAHRADTTGKTILVALALIDPSARVALFTGLGPIRFDPGVDQGKKRI